MRRKIIALALTCLALNGVAAAADSKTGFDPKTGKFRPLTAAESAELDRQDRVRAANSKMTAGRATALAVSQPLVQLSSAGYRVIAMPEELYSHTSASIDANGNLTVQHSDADGAVHTEELPHE